jgi:hypothetical protein
MQFTNFEEFWAALGRLYDETLEIKESIKASRQAAERAAENDRELIHAQGESIKGLAEVTQRPLVAAEKHQLVVESHERRLDRTEVTVEAILVDLRRHREQRPSQ